MKTNRNKITINEKKKNVVIISDSFNLTDMVEIFLYKKYNVIATIDEFDGMKQIEYFKPVCIFIKVSENTSPIEKITAKMKNIHSQNIPLIAFTKDNISVISEFTLKSAGIREIIKFPIRQHDFLTIIEAIIN